MRQNGVLTYLHNDHLGSSVLTTNATTNATQTYRAYSKVRTYSGPFHTRYQFTGKYVDDSVLNYMNARYFDRSIGMFISPDTIVPDTGATVSYNRCAYANLNPMMFIAPSGHIPENEICSLFGICGDDGYDQFADKYGNNLADLLYGTDVSWYD